MRNIDANTVELMIANRFATRMMDLANEIRAQADKEGVDSRTLNVIADTINAHDFFSHAEAMRKSRREDD